jgi:hypothetical protein
MFSRGPMGAMLMLIGVALVGLAVWQLVGNPKWVEQLPTLFIGLALGCFGYSSVRKARD